MVETREKMSNKKYLCKKIIFFKVSLNLPLRTEAFGSVQATLLFFLIFLFQKFLFPYEKINFPFLKKHEKRK